MNSNVKYIQFNFASLSNSEICAEAIKLANDSREWVKKCSTFILEWLNESEFISAKSSGTTQQAKTFQIAKNKIRASAKMTQEAFHLQNGCNALLCLSIDFIAGKMMVARSEVNRWNLIVVEPSANPLRDLHLQIDFAAFVPNQVFEILSNDNLSKFNQINKVIIGGGEINETLKNLLKKVTCEVYQTFGMTETVSHIAIKQICPLEDKFYKALKDIYFEKSNENCLIIHAPQLEKDPIITKDCIELFSDTAFNWLGRYDNIINTGAVKVNPEIIELKIKKHINNEFIVSSIPHDKLMNKLILVVEGDEKVDLDLINKELERFEQLKEIKIISRFPRTISGKIIRRH